jgi:hypothetical protein
MKGPRSRHKFCVLRVWECPLCHKRASVAVDVVNRVCFCQGKDHPTWMHLIEERRSPAKLHAPLAPIDDVVGS